MRRDKEWKKQVPLPLQRWEVNYDPDPRRAFDGPRIIIIKCLTTEDRGQLEEELAIWQPTVVHSFQEVRRKLMSP